MICPGTDAESLLVLDLYIYLCRGSLIKTAAVMGLAYNVEACVASDAFLPNIGHEIACTMSHADIKDISQLLHLIKII